MESKQHPMMAALDEARRAAGRGEVPVGAVVTDAAGRILAAAGNRVEELGDPSAHAELLALRAALAVRAAGQDSGEARLDGCDLYVTLEPCTMCAGAISLFRIRRLYFAAYDPKGGGVEHGARFFERPTCLHRPEVYGGLHESAARNLLQQFFRARR